MNIHCLKCGRKTKNVASKLKTTVNGRPYIQCKCDVCGSKKNRFVSKKSLSGRGIGVAGAMDAGAKLIDSLGNAAGAIGDTVAKNREVAQDIRERTGKNEQLKEKWDNRADIESSMGFNRYWSKLQKTRVYKPSLLPPRLKLQSFGLNNLNFKKRSNRDAKQRADDALYQYALDTYKGD